MRHLGELTSDEVDDFVFALETAAVKAMIKLNVGGLSELDVHDVYGAIGAAVRGEYKKARKRVKSRPAKQSQS